jgi:MoaA/NifB/PqqE/SkfB family radical SAM enzyme
MSTQMLANGSSHYWAGDYQPMGMRMRHSRASLIALNAGINLLVSIGPALARIRPLRQAMARIAERGLDSMRETALRSAIRPPGAEDDRYDLGRAIVHTVERALAEDRMSPATRHTILRTLIRDNLFLQGNWAAKEGFRQRNGAYPPDFMLVSPGKACNLRCVGCYADSGANREKLDWAVLDRLINEAHDRLGNRFFVISGGEPMAYRSDGKGVLDLAERHPDSMFLMYSNGTLIDDAVARRMAALGNVTPALSVEGLRGATEQRRGVGVFDRILAAMARLRREKVVFGVSLTATRLNSDELLSDEAVDFYFGQQGALYGWIFHYMPIGRAYTLELLPTPEQRMRLWRRSWQLIRERRIFLADFWNMATVTDGCISAGREGGYLCVDWNGAVTPCVFMPYSPVNVNQVFANGGTLDDVWAQPFFAGVRGWQRANGFHQPENMAHGNWLMPCPIRDHHRELRQIVLEHEPDPVDENARQALLDPGYAQGLIAYDQELEQLMRPVWDQQYLRRNGEANGS